MGDNEIQDSNVEGFKTLVEVQAWIEGKDQDLKSDKRALKAIYCIEEKEKGLGIMFVNSPIGVFLKEGMYFRDSDFNDGEVCQVNTTDEINHFISVARVIYESENEDRGNISFKYLE